MTVELRNEPQQARANARLAALRAATRESIDAVGWQRVTTAMIAERAGASIGTVYRYYPDVYAALQDVMPVHPHGIERVLALHHPDGEYPPVETVETTAGPATLAPNCAFDHEKYPCRTVRELVGDEQP